MELNFLTRVESHAVDLYKLSEQGKQSDKKKKKSVLVSKDASSKKTTVEAEARRKKVISQDDSYINQDTASAVGAIVTGDGEYVHSAPKLMPPREQTLSPSMRKSKSVPFSLATLPEDDEDDESDVGGSSTHKKFLEGDADIIEAKVARMTETIVSTTLKKDEKSSSWRDLRKFITVRSLTVEEQKKFHYEDLFGCATRNFGKGFALGFALRCAMNLFSELVQVLRRTQKFNGASFIKEIFDGAKDHGVFFALLLSLHNSIMFVSRDLPHRMARYRGGLAGFVGAVVSLWSLPYGMRRAVTLFAFVRAFELVFRMGAKRGTLPSINNGDTALMCLASGLMIPCWIFYNSLDKSYTHFLVRQVQLPLPVIRAISIIQLGTSLEDLPALNAARKVTALGRPLMDIIDPMGYDSPLLSVAEKAAIILHPTQSFPEFAIRFFINGLRNAAPVYVPVYAVPLVMFSRKRLFNDPIKTLSTALQGAARSSVFLALYCTVGVCSLSLFRRLGMRAETIGRFAALSPVFAGSLAGLATFIEKRSRRIELALYVFSKAVEGVHNVLKQKLGDKVAAPFGGDALLFGLSFAVVVHANLRYPELVRESYRALLLRFFDTDERHTFF